MSFTSSEEDGDWLEEELEGMGDEDDDDEDYRPNNYNYDTDGAVTGKNSSL
jgi:hypothetical protein